MTLDRKHGLQHVRLAAVSWGDDRLRAAHQALEWHPDLALAHWFAATVLVARQLFDRALEQVRLGCALQDARRIDGNGRYPAAGLHWWSCTSGESRCTPGGMAVYTVRFRIGHLAGGRCQGSGSKRRGRWWPLPGVGWQAPRR